MVSNNCPVCTNPWPNCICMKCTKCGSKTGICNCSSVVYTAGANAHITTSSSAKITWSTGISCGLCVLPLYQCKCISGGLSPYPAVGPFTGGCTTCGSSAYPCICFKGYTTTKTHIAYMPPREVLCDFDFFDVHSNNKLESASTILINAKDDELGYNGHLSFLKLPVNFKGYFLNYGLIGGRDVWQILSPLLFKLIVKEPMTSEESTHFVTILNTGFVKEDPVELFVSALDVQEITDNFTFLRLMARDSEYRKNL